jgi:hypothetical protein
VEELVEQELAGETEILGKALPPVPLGASQIPYILTWHRTRAAAVRSRR